MEKQAKIKYDFLSHAVCILFLLYTVLRTYALFGIRMADVMDYLLIFVYLIKCGINPKVLPQKLNNYFVFWVISVVFSSTWSGLNGLRPLMGIVHSYLFYLMLFDKSDKELLLKYYRLIGFGFICFFFLQEFTFYTIGARISGLIPGLAVLSDFESASEFAQYRMYNGRSSSLFSEPAHFVQFLLPLLAVELFGAEDKKHNIRALIIVVALLLSQSGNAMFGLAAIAVVYVVKRFSENRSFTTIAVTIVILAGAVAGGIYYLSTEKGKALIDRKDQLSLTDYESGKSGFFRIYRGYYVYDNLSPIEKIIGVNDFSTLKARINTSEVGFMFGDDDTYFNAVQDIMIRTGLIGLFIFILFLADLWKHNNYLGKSLICCLITLAFISAINLTSTMAMFLVLAIYAKKNNKIQNIR